MKEDASIEEQHEVIIIGWIDADELFKYHTTTIIDGRRIEQDQKGE